MLDYEIMRWDSVLVKNNTFPYPMIYVKADLNLLNYARENKYIFPISISETNMDYDKKPVIGIMDTSGYYPNYRPNFFNETGYYTITIFTNWIGYPIKNGKISIDNDSSETQLKNEIKEEKIKPIEHYKKDEKCNNLTFNQISLLCLCILIFFVFILVLSLKK